MDQEEIENPVGLCGDLMRYFEHQDIPAFDQIFFYGRSHQAAKVVSSAATNYDRALVMCECYGVQEQLTDVDLYREAIDLFVRGANVLIPHALWYTPETKDFPPDLSPHDPYYGPHIAELQRLGCAYPVAASARTAGSRHRRAVSDPHAAGSLPFWRRRRPVRRRIDRSIRHGLPRTC